MRRNRPSIFSSPVLIGAVTTLVVAVAVLIAYGANQGLPFVPVFTIRAETDNAARLVVGNDVREGGQRIGQITKIDTVRLRNGRVGALLTLEVQKSAAPFPADSDFVIRARSTLGQKYVDLVRGDSPRALVDNAVIDTRLVTAPDIDVFFSLFDKPTRRAVRENLDVYGTGFSGRGAALNQTLATLPPLLRDLSTVSRTLAAPSTRLRELITALGRFTATTAPVAGALAHGIGAAATTFDALSEDPDALRDTIAESPSTLITGIRTLPRDRPLLQALTALAPSLQGTAQELTAGGPTISRALASGTRVLPQTPALNRRLTGTLEALRRLSVAPFTNPTLRGLQTTTGTLNPTLRYVGPHITVCNYWNYFWTYLSAHLAEEVPSGTAQRIEVKTAPLTQGNSMMRFGATAPANGEPVNPVEQGAFGDPANLHAQPYGRAVDEQGNADCEQGQRGYPTRLAAGAPEGLNIAVDPRTPGDQGPTFTGRPRVPAGETFSAEPDGTAPQVAMQAAAP